MLDATFKKSTSVRSGSALESAGDPTREYAKVLTPAQISRIDAILERFGRPFYERPLAVAI
jgi:hypothetical protein